MYTNIYFDSKKEKIYLTEVINGKRVSGKYDIDNDYYIEDPTGRSEVTDIYGTPVQKKFSNSRYVIKNLREGMTLYQSDINEEQKFLLRRYGDKKIQLDMDNINTCFIDIEIESGNSFPKPELAEYPVNLITFKSSLTGKVYTFGNREYTGENPLFDYYFYVPDEKRMLEKVISAFRKLKFDIITGWNTGGFDIPYLVRRFRKLGIEQLLSPYNIDYIENKDEGFSIPGISCLDYLALYKKFSQGSRESYSLDNIGLYEVGEGKLDYDGALHTLYKTDWNTFVDYNVQDVLLVEKIDKKKKFIEFAINLCYESGSPFDKCFSPVYMITGLVLKFLWKNNMVLNDKQRNESEYFEGAFVQANPGFYEKVMSFDITSMYPHLIMQFNISPETLVVDPPEDEKPNLIKTPSSHVFFRKDKIGIMPTIVKMLFDSRKHERNKGKICEMVNDNLTVEEISDRTRLSVDYIQKALIEIEEENGNPDFYDTNQMAKKIYANSLYGILSSPHFHLYNLHNASTVTYTGRELIKFLSNSASKYFLEFFHKDKRFFKEEKEENKIKKDPLILLDTDSNYLHVEEIYEKIGNGEDFLTWCNKFDREFFEKFWEKLLEIYAAKYNTDNKMHFKREKIIAKQLVQAKKKYATLVLDNEGYTYDNPKISVTGLETVRNDIPRVVRNKLQEILEEIFETNANDKEHINSIIRKFKKEFSKFPIEQISSPTGISDYDKYYDKTKITQFGITYPKHCPIHARAAISYNYLLNKHKFPYLPISNGTKMKYIYVKTNKNFMNQNVIGYVGNWPTEFDDIFVIDHSLQFQKTFVNLMQRIYDVLGWGEIELNKNKIQSFLN